MAIHPKGNSPNLDLACVLFELVIVITVVTLLNGRSQWHERWLDYRVLAELIRQQRLLTPVAGNRPLPRHRPHHAAYGDPAQSWMYWHVRAICRSVGAPSVRVVEPYQTECLAHMWSAAAAPGVGQKGFHEHNVKRYETIHRRLHDWALRLFKLSIAAIVVHLVLTLPGFLVQHVPGPKIELLDATHRFVTPFETSFRGWTILFATVLPAFGAALASINNQGEFSRLAKRSRAMADQFTGFEKRIKGLQDRLEKSGPLPLAEISDLAGEMTNQMVEENLDWRVVVSDLQHVAGDAIRGSVRRLVRGLTPTPGPFGGVNQPALSTRCGRSAGLRCCQNLAAWGFYAGSRAEPPCLAHNACLI